MAVFAGKLSFGSGAYVLAGALAATAFATPAAAKGEPSAELVRCGSESCLRISGQRDNADALVLVNGQPVECDGGRNWRVQLPVSRVRDLSAPFARTIDITLYEPGSSAAASVTAVDLPIGLLGGVTQLASLVVRVE